MSVAERQFLLFIFSFCLLRVLRASVVILEMGKKRRMQEAPPYLLAANILRRVPLALPVLPVKRHVTRVDRQSLN